MSANPAGRPGIFIRILSNHHEKNVVYSGRASAGSLYDGSDGCLRRNAPRGRTSGDPHRVFGPGDPHAVRTRRRRRDRLQLECRRPYLGRRRAEHRGRYRRSGGRLRFRQSVRRSSLPGLLQHDGARSRGLRPEPSVPGRSGRTATRAQRRFRICDRRCRRKVRPFARYGLHLVRSLVAGRRCETGLRVARRLFSGTRVVRTPQIRRPRIRRSDRSVESHHAVVRGRGRRVAPCGQRRGGIRCGGRLSGGLFPDGVLRNLRLRRRKRLHRNPCGTRFRTGAHLSSHDRDHRPPRRYVRRRTRRGTRRSRLPEIRRRRGAAARRRGVDSRRAHDFGTRRLDRRSGYRPPHPADCAARRLCAGNGPGKYAYDPLRRRGALLAGVLRARLHAPRGYVRADGGQYDLRERFGRLFRPARPLPRTGLRTGQCQRNRQCLAGHVYG